MRMSCLATLRGRARGARKRPAQVGTTPMPTSGRPNRAVLGRDDEVAGEDDLEPAAEGRALDRGDQRLPAPTADDAVLPAACRHVVAAGRQVAAGAEDVGAAGQDAGPQLVVVVQLVQGVVERVGHRPVDGVPLRGPLHGDDQDVAVTASPDHERRRRQSRSRVSPIR